VVPNAAKAQGRRVRGVHTGAVLIHRHDAGRDEHEWRAFVTSQGFGHLVAAGVGRSVPVVVPTQFVLDGDHVWLHLAGPNPLLDALAEQSLAVLSVAGDWAYIPAAWKAIGDEDPALGIPTTYYAAVQLTGPVTVLDQPADVADVLRRQLAALEPGSGAVDPEQHGAKLRAIRGLRLDIQEVRAKLKYGGNVDAAHRAAIAERLAERAGPGDAAALAHVRRRS
jgi:transcriptional regulator